MVVIRHSQTTFAGLEDLLHFVILILVLILNWRFMVLAIAEFMNSEASLPTY